MKASLIISADDSEVITLRQAASIAGCALFSIQRAIIRGDLPCGRVGYMHVVRLEDAIKYAETRRAPNGQRRGRYNLKPAAVADSTSTDLTEQGSD